MSLKILDAIPRIAALHWPQRENYAAFSPPVEQTASSNDKQRASPLLNLPRELRDMVYVYFLEAHRSAPPSPPFAGPRIFRLDLEHNDAELVPQKDIAYPVSIPQSNIHALLQVNRRVRSEVLELADKRNRRSKPLPAELDIMATGYVLYPLWTRLPTLASGTATLSVTVNVRIFSPEAFRARDGPRFKEAFAKTLSAFITSTLTMAPIKVGLMGYGFSTKCFHLPFITPNADLEVYAFLQRAEAPTDKTGPESGKHCTVDYPKAKHYRTADDFFADAEIELVIVCTSSNNHAEFAEKAMRSGKHGVSLYYKVSLIAPN